MKKYVLLFVVLFVTSIGFSQNPESTFVDKDGLVEATYYYENGNIEQTGTFKNGKLHGVWTSYDVNGSKLAVGNYENGKKTGKWFFWVDSTLKEVDYADSRIVSVHEWKDKNEVAIRNR
mgnify:CR=1 FL=1